MKHFRYIRFCLVFLALTSSAADWISVTTNFCTHQLQDSFDFSQFGNGDGCFREEQLALYNPTHYGRFFCNSHSGAGNFLMLTNDDSMYGSIVWSMSSSNQVITWFTTSDNGGVGSNDMYAQTFQQLEAPTMLYDRFGNFTNDWTFPTNTVQHIMLGDYPQWVSDARPGVLAYSLGGSNAASAQGWHFADRWSPLALIVSNAFAAGDHLFQGTGVSEDHPRFPLQFCGSCTYWQQEGVDTNTFTATLDWNSSSVTTNHCTVSGYSRVGSALTFSLLADRQAPSFDTGMGGFTNDCRHAFDLIPQFTNTFMEVVQVLNAPDGTYNLAMDGTVIATPTGAQLRAGYNLWLCYNSALFQQGLQVLSYLRILRNINPMDASSTYTNGNYLMGDLRSNEAAVWSTNTLGNTFYTTQTIVSNKAQVVINFCDTMIHPAVQQTNHTFSITSFPPRYAPFHR
ncbi:MAG TPA: hypothetical protein VG938_17370 [Verrucomicrobiae bacterium]|jgi:hypothetical protein|nr:hypothetical protein [Verrucomicrobiae bacterium]